MKRLTLLPGLLFLMLQAVFSQESGSCKPVNLVCDYLVNPLGIDNPTPRLSWMLNDARKRSTTNSLSSHRRQRLS